MATKTPNFDGRAFPIVTVRLGNHKGNATLNAPGGTYRARLNYSYDQPDGVNFAAKAARAAWEKYRAASMSDEYPYDPGTADEIVLVPGNAKDGYTFTVVPARFF